MTRRLIGAAEDAGGDGWLVLRGRVYFVVNLHICMYICRGGGPPRPDVMDQAG